MCIIRECHTVKSFKILNEECFRMNGDLALTREIQC